MRIPTPPIERFYRHTERNGACLLWTGTVAGSRSKRPMFRNTTSQHDPKVYAHRWIYEQLVGPIPEGLEIDHTCKNGLCVEITHLEPVTQEENNRRARLSKCTAGLHDLGNDDDCAWDNRGRRRGCRLCRNERARRRYHSKRGGQ